MLKSEQRFDAPMPAQVAFWNHWNAQWLEREIGEVSIDQARVIVGWLQQQGRTDLDIIDVGCGAGWLCEQLSAFGQVIGTDLADEVIARAALRVPSARFLSGDFMELNFGDKTFDVITSLEVLPHVADQRAFISKLAGLLRPGGHLMFAVQNRWALERNDVPPPAPGQIRRWVDCDELSELLSREFEIEALFSITPRFNRGALKYLNSRKLHALLSLVGLKALSRTIRVTQEGAWFGWTLMALARKRPR